MLRDLFGRSPRSRRGRRQLSPRLERFEGRSLMSGVTAQTLFAMAEHVAQFRAILNIGRFQRPVAPTFRVQSVALGDRAGRVVVRFQGAEGGGIDPSTLTPEAFTLVRRQSPLVPLRPTAIATPTVLPDVLIPPDSSPATSEPTVAAVLDFGRPLPVGNYRLRIESGGLRDRAGNPLDGEFRGRFPSGDGVPGGDFAAATATNGFFSYRPRGVANLPRLALLARRFQR